MNTVTERYPERWRNYLQARDVYRALPSQLRAYCRGWLEVVEIFVTFHALLGDVNVVVCPVRMSRGARYSVPVAVNPATMPRNVDCLCCVPAYSDDNSQEILRAAVSLRDDVKSRNWVCKLPPGDYSEELFELIAQCQTVFASVTVWTPSVGSPDQECRYIVCLDRGGVTVAPSHSAAVLRHNAIESRDTQHTAMTAEFLDTVEYPDSRAMVDAAVLDWNMRAHLLRRSTK